MSSENQNIVITIDQTKYQSYEFSTVLECWGLINLNILQAENQTYHLENLWGIYKQQHWYIRNYLSGVTTLVTTLQHQICDNNHTNFQCYP